MTTITHAEVTSKPSCGREDTSLWQQMTLKLTDKAMGMKMVQYFGPTCT